MREREVREKENQRKRERKKRERDKEREREREKEIKKPYILKQRLKSTNSKSVFFDWFIHIFYFILNIQIKFIIIII